MCFEYPLQRITENSTNYNEAYLRAQIFLPSTKTGSSPFTQSNATDVRLHFPKGKELKAWGTKTFLMVTDGDILSWKSGQTTNLLMLLYGNYANQSKYSIVAVKSTDDGKMSYSCNVSMSM